VEKQAEEQMEEHVEQLRQMEQSRPLPTAVLYCHHISVQTKPIGRCECGKLHPPGCPRKRQPKKRKFGTDITEPTVNGASEAILGGSRTHNACSKCQVSLCIEGPCWQQYHHSIGVNFKIERPQLIEKSGLLTFWTPPNDRQR
jgi:hypothetical protein